jgi:hypothetical protein
MIYICDSCGNIYEITRAKEGEDYNDFGIRYCHYCGSMFDILPIGREAAACKK